MVLHCFVYPLDCPVISPANSALMLLHNLIFSASRVEPSRYLPKLHFRTYRDRTFQGSMFSSGSVVSAPPTLEHQSCTPSPADANIVTLFYEFR
jgi:hypothetical protein